MKKDTMLSFAGISVDWITNVVYWTDATYDVILAASLESAGRAEPVIDTGLDDPHAIICYPQKG